MTNRTMQLTDQQAQAVDIRKNIAVTAGAGTGKTRVLVTRYMQLLAPEGGGIHPDQIVAITFTRKAAAEMKRRIWLEVCCRLGEPKQDVGYWIPLLKAVPKSPIGTIHAFATRILRDFPLESGVDPLFSVEDSGQMPEAVGQAVDAAMQQMDGDEVWQPLMRQVLRYFPGKDLRWILGSVAGNPDRLDILKNAASQDSGEIIWENVVKPVMDNLDEMWLIQGVRLVTPTSKTGAKVHEAVVSSWEDLKAEDYSVRFQALDRILGQLYTGKGSGRKLSEKDPATPALNVLQEQMQPLIWLNGIVNMKMERLSQQLSEILWKISDRTWDLLVETRRRTPALSFDDLEMYSLELLERSQCREHVIETLKQKYRYFFIDEFQDTNQVQWRIVRPLITDDEKLMPGRLFIVGDPKQSIYGFRGADVTVFNRVKDRIAGIEGNHGKDVLLDRNFRSTPDILNFVDLVCGKMMLGGAEYEVPFQRLHSERKNLPDGEVGLLINYTGDDSGNPDKVSEKYQWCELLAQHIQRMVSSCRFDYGDIAVMFPARTRLAEMEAALYKYAIPFTVYKGTGFWKRQEIQDLTSFLIWLSEPFRKIELYTVLRSPLFGFSDEQLMVLNQYWHDFPFKKPVMAMGDILPELQAEMITGAQTILLAAVEISGRTPVYSILESFLVETGGFGSYSALPEGEQVPENIQQFLEIICKMDHERPLPLHSLVRQLIGLRDSQDPFDSSMNVELKQNTVTLMTVHASKGLEFPVVYLTGLEQGRRFQGNKFLLDETEGVGYHIPDYSSHGSSQKNAVYKILEKRMGQKDLSEYKRLLYVAMTRAQNCLYLILTQPSRPSQRSMMFLQPRENTWLFWVVDALNLMAEDLEKSIKYVHTRDGQEIGIGLYTLEDSSTAEANREFGTSFLADLLLMEPQPMPARTEPIQDTVRGKRIFSVTELDLFRKSPDDYFRRYILNIPEHFKHLSSQSPADLAQLTGNAFHGLMEHEMDSDYEKAEEFLRHYAGRSRLNEKEAQLFRNRVLDMLAGLSSWPEWDTLKALPGYRELSFSLETRNGIINGTIDWLVEDHGRWIIVDYKTSKWTGGDLDNWMKEHREEYEFQMQVYALAANRFLENSQQNYPVLIYFADVCRAIPFHFSQTALNAFSHQLERLTEEVIDRLHYRKKA